MLKRLLEMLFGDKKNNQTAAVNRNLELFHANQAELEEIMKTPFPDGKLPGYVYFVQEHLTGTINIGKTKNITKRMNVYHIKLPMKNELIYFIKTGNYHQTKAAFHNYFAAKQADGEWFKLLREDVEWIKKCQYTEEIQDSILDQGEEQDVTLTGKQLEYALSLINKLSNEYQLATDPAKLTVKDLNRLTVYFKYKNKGALVNLVKKGILAPNKTWANQR